MSLEETRLTIDPQKPFLVFCYHDTVKDVNAMPVPTHFSMMTCKTVNMPNGGMEQTFEIKTNAIYCQRSGEIKFNNGYPTLTALELAQMAKEILKEVDVIQILYSDNQLYYVRQVLGYEGPVIQVKVDQPYKGVITANACIPLANHNTFSCSHCLLLAILSRQNSEFNKKLYVD